MAGKTQKESPTISSDDNNHIDEEHIRDGSLKLSIKYKSVSLSSTESLTLEEEEEEDEGEEEGEEITNNKVKKRSTTNENSSTKKSHSDRHTQGFVPNLNLSEQSRDSGVHLDCDPNTSPPGGRSKDAEDVGGGGGVGGTSQLLQGHSKSSSLPHGVKLCPEEKEDASKKERCASLEEELKKTQDELKAKDQEVEVLKGIREQVEGELEDLTASLFQEAHKMVTEAKTKEAASEKSLTETRMQLEGLQAEVAALKALLITSTPSRPNLGGQSSNSNGISLFKKQHKRTPSHNHLYNYGSHNGHDQDQEQGQGGNAEKRNFSYSSSGSGEVTIDRGTCDVDPILLGHFAAWRGDPTLVREKSPFLQKMYAEDIDPCLSFADPDLVERLREAVEENSVWVEPVPEKDRNNVPKECALLKCQRVCHYRMRFAFDSEEWFEISKMCRDRIAAVCEFLNYLRYTKNGLVKASVEDAYWEMLRLRKQMATAKLGISIS